MLLLKVHHGDFQALIFVRFKKGALTQPRNTPCKLIICSTCLAFNSVT